jgi:competence protein ComEA
MSSPSTLPPRSKTTVERSPSSAMGVPAVPVSVWGLCRGDRWFLAIMLAVLVGLLAMHARRDAVRQAAPVTMTRAPDAEPYVFRLDPNTATWVEWTQLSGIGPTLARRIIDDRQTNGPYRTVEDLRRVKGIGVKTLEKMRPHLIFAEAD